MLSFRPKFAAKVVSDRFVGSIGEGETLFVFPPRSAR